MVNNRVVELNLEEFSLTGAVPAEVGRLSAHGVVFREPGAAQYHWGLDVDFSYFLEL